MSFSTCNGGLEIFENDNYIMLWPGYDNKNSVDFHFVLF